MKIIDLLLAFLAVLFVGTLGYHFIEHWSYFDSFYMTALTITTVGFTEGQPMTVAGRVFTLIILFAGFGVAFTALSHIAASFLRGELQQLLGRRRMEKDLKRMSDHYILCGFGRMGRVIAQEFNKKGIAYTVIEKEPAQFRGDRESDRFPFIIGNASDEEILRAAGVDRAAGLVAAVASDADNAFITMTARGLNPNLKIVARAGDASSVNKLKLAGADKVISPYIIGGVRIAQAILSPALVDFMEVATDHGSLEIEMADVEIPRNSPYNGMTLEDPKIKSLGLIFVSIQRRNHDMVFKPDAKTVLHEGDRVIAVGNPMQIQKMIVDAHQ